MTICAAWVRNVNNTEELVFASDSRLSGGGELFDGCAKLLTFSRRDCAIAFAGDTLHAFPMMQQLALAIQAHEPAEEGMIDISELRRHALNLFSSMARQISCSPLTHPPQEVVVDAKFLFGGYSWMRKRFELWKITYDQELRRFISAPAPTISFEAQAGKFLIRRGKTKTVPASKICIGGDQAELATTLLLQKLSSRDGKTFNGLNWEPFEVIRDMLRAKSRAETIGGAPQIIKVYPYRRSAPLAVFWPIKRNGKVFLQGRECLDYESIDHWILDPDALRSQHLKHTNNRQSGKEESEPHQTLRN